MKKRLPAVIAALALLFATAFSETEADYANVNRWLGTLGYLQNASNATAEERAQALGNFQRANGLEITGRADDDTLRVLMSEAAVSEKDCINAELNGYAQQEDPTLGSSGEDVLELQLALGELGYFEGEADGRFGEDTARAVRRFRIVCGLSSNGGADASLRRRLYNAEAVALSAYLDALPSQPGDESPRVRVLQSWLRETGMFEGKRTGHYGRFTMRAVKRFQKSAGLEESGIFDRDTACALFEAVCALEEGRLAPDYAMVKERLDALGYPAHEAADLQTELAVMLFRHENGLASGTRVDRAFMEALTGGEARPAQEVTQFTLPDARQREDIAQEALDLLGHSADFDTSYGLVCYAYLKRGVALPQADRLTFEEFDGDAQAGDIVAVCKGNNRIFGIATTDDAFVFCANNGYIVLRYIDNISADVFLRARLSGEA